MFPFGPAVADPSIDAQESITPDYTRLHPITLDHAKPFDSELDSSECLGKQQLGALKYNPKACSKGRSDLLRVSHA